MVAGEFWAREWRQRNGIPKFHSFARPWLLRGAKMRRRWECRLHPAAAAVHRTALMKITITGLFALLCAVVLGCGDAVAAAASQSAATLAKAEILAIDKDNLTLTVAGKTEPKDQVIQITSQTRLFLGKKNATTSELKVGQKVSGSLHKGKTGKLEAVRLQLDDAKADAKPDEKPAAKGSKPTTKSSKPAPKKTPAN